MHITDHAVERFIKRHAPEKGWVAAKQHLEEAAKVAIRLRERTLLGQEQWEIQNPYCILVVKNDPKSGKICVTVLPQPENMSISQDEMELMQEAARKLPPLIPPRPTESPRVRATAPKPAKKPNLRCVPKTNQQLVLQLAITKQQEKTKRHFAELELTNTQLKRCLRAAGQFLVREAAKGDPLAREILEEIQVEEPGLITSRFLGCREANK